MGQNNIPSSWDEASVARLREHHASGVSLSIIASKLNAEFGTNFTRSSCAGKSHRLRLEKRVFLAAETKVKHERQRPGPPKDVPHGWKKTPFRVHLLERPEFHSGNPAGPGITIFMLKEYSCRWPETEIGPSEFLFCGHPVEEGCSWCSHHRAIAVRPYRR
jgi:GcrA cell cycle regulator